MVVVVVVVGEMEEVDVGKIVQLQVIFIDNQVFRRKRKRMKMRTFSPSRMIGFLFVESTRLHLGSDSDNSLRGEVGQPDGSRPWRGWVIRRSSVCVPKAKRSRIEIQRMIGGITSFDGGAGWRGACLDQSGGV
jgi:hypothetical protein